MLFLRSVPFHFLSLASYFPLHVAAQFPPKPEGLQVIQSKVLPGSSISFKQTHICETTDGVKAYSGYVRLPPNPQENRNYEINTFFWFFEARENPKDAPLSLWLQGGPGVPSITAAVGENGPCVITSDSRTSTLNPWSFSRRVNMLYIDQPSQVGFSYDTLVNGTIDQIKSPVAVTVDKFEKGVPKTNNTFLVGTFASQNNQTTANTTVTAASALWHFMQTWMQEFPVYKPANNKFSIWTESYGGHYGPAIGDFFDAQNEALKKTNASVGAIPLSLETLGIINGCIDAKTQIPFYPQFAHNNTYGIEVINASALAAAEAAWPACHANITACHRAYLAAGSTPAGSNQAVNKICDQAYGVCFQSQWQSYNGTGRNVFDVQAMLPDPFPPKFAAGYLNNATIQAALGVPLNFTGQSVAVASVFQATGDFIYPGGLERLARLLDRGVRVALVYGDADFQCNWLGGEAISLAINSTVSPQFHEAGYANISTNGSHVGGVVRQVNNLSFSRVFNAGHEVPYYQPETAYQIFDRVMFSKDIATGKLTSGGCGCAEYRSEGPSCIFEVKNKAAPQPQPSCYLWDALETCNKADKEKLLNGTAVVKDFVLQA